MSKPHFAAVPLLALSDDRLTALHLRLLGWVAYHDRFGRNGMGCYASQARLAELCRANRSNVATALSELVNFGYLTSEPGAEDKRRRMHRVIYDQSELEMCCPQGNESGRDMLPPGNVSTEMCCPDGRDVLPASPSKPAESLESCREYTLRDPVKRHISSGDAASRIDLVKRRRSRETTPRNFRHADVDQISPSDDGTREQDATYLRRVEAFIKAGMPGMGQARRTAWAEDTLEKLGLLCDVHDADEGEGIGGWARRLSMSVVEYASP